MMHDRVYVQRAPEESIYNLIKVEAPPPPKQKRYVSKYPHDTPPTASTFGPSAVSQILSTNLAGNFAPQPRNHRHTKAFAQLGPKNEHYSDPTRYLTKGNKPSLPEPKKFQYTDCYDKKQGPPSLSQTLPRINPLEQSQKKNYIQMNALAAMTQEPGNRGKEEASFRSRPGFGKVPKYLDKVKKEIVAEQDFVAHTLHQQRQQHQYEMGGMQQTRLLEEDERLSLLENLKSKWEDTNTKYQAMTHLVVLDTMGKVRRKEEHEHQLQELEKSIAKLSKQYVFVEG